MESCAEVYNNPFSFYLRSLPPSSLRDSRLYRAPRNEVKRQGRNSPVECHGDRGDEERETSDRVSLRDGNDDEGRRRKENEAGKEQTRRGGDGVTGNGVLVSIFIRTFGAFIATEQPEEGRKREKQRERERERF